ncbi:hypothetical protein FNV43_RR14176 [Rhamnella rubrinervis]|uniref:Uncharacterized protein n=1 Tax=Rhamnella rubrinervis TaxID=2594499 RepID=A0A8K0MFD6_9ROSA|nr:hypothetical protein FNV43_RR14176 [Rhamnella rubrinervis]
MDRKDPAVNPRNGFDSVTKIFHSLRPPLDLPPQRVPYLSQRTPCLSAATCLGLTLSPSSIPPRVSASPTLILFAEQTLAANLQATIGLSKGDTAFILSQLHSDSYPQLLTSHHRRRGLSGQPAQHQVRDSPACRAFQTSHRLFHVGLGSQAPKAPPENCYHRFARVRLDDREFNTGTRTSRSETIRSSGGHVFFRNNREGSRRRCSCTRCRISTYSGFYSWKSVAVNDTVVVMEKYELSKMLRAVEEFRVTHLALVPAVVVAMVKADHDHITASYDLSSLESVGCGAAPLGKDMITAFKSRFPNVVLAQGYGLTETTGAVFRTVNPEELSQRWDSTGRLLRGSEAKIVDPDTGGWLRTGDLCYIDEEGLLYVVDRLKELIKYKGYQVAPAELEQLLLSHPLIVDAAVIPYPDEEAGQLPMAVVVKQSKCTLDESEVIDFVAKQVSPYKKIRRVVFVDSIPKTGTGKILRKELKNILTPGSLSKL